MGVMYAKLTKQEEAWCCAVLKQKFYFKNTYILLQIQCCALAGYKVF
jgi:hypothetical protein